MKNKIKYFLLTIAIAFTMVGCGNLPKKNTNNIGSSMYGQIMVLNERGLDSLCVVDTLPRNLNLWISNSYVDYETNETRIKKMYIKEISSGKETIYVLIPEDEMYKITKRQVKSE